MTIMNKTAKLFYEKIKLIGSKIIWMLSQQFIVYPSPNNQFELFNRIWNSALAPLQMEEKT